MTEDFLEGDPGYFKLNSFPSSIKTDFLQWANREAILLSFEVFRHYQKTRGLFTTRYVGIQ
jgi:hypothetical protein